MISRKTFVQELGLAAAGLAFGGCATDRGRSGGKSACWSYDGVHGLKISSAAIREPLRMRIIADTHLTLIDDRDRDFAGHCKRMSQWGLKPKDFEALLPSRNDCDLLVLAGDILSFPTLANVEYLDACLRGCDVPYAYVAGNHDWHFEGDAGSDFEQRNRWIEKRLKPLYCGRDPLVSSVCVKGCKIILVDNSVYHVTDEQLAGFRRELADDRPSFLVQHIPFWRPGYGITTCCSPGWGAANDPYWEIERRERWSERLMPSTFDFRDEVYSSSSLVGVLTGHIHRFMASEENGLPQWVVPGSRANASIDVDLNVERSSCLCC